MVCGVYSPLLVSFDDARWTVRADNQQEHKTTSRNIGRYKATTVSAIDVLRIPLLTTSSSSIPPHHSLNVVSGGGGSGQSIDNQVKRCNAGFT